MMLADLALDTKPVLKAGYDAMYRGGGRRSLQKLPRPGVLFNSKTYICDPAAGLMMLVFHFNVILMIFLYLNITDLACIP